MVDEVGGQKLLKGIQISLALRLEEAARQGFVRPRWVEIIHDAPRGFQRID